MVIKMANGMTITIGPNEIENIVFNDGAVTVSGKRIDDFVSSLDLLEKKTETLTSKADLVAAITDLEAKINEVGTAKNSEIRAEIDAIEAQLQNLKDNSGSSYDDTVVKENIAKLQAAQDEIKYAIMNLEAQIANIGDGSSNDNIEKRVNDLQMQIDYLKVVIDSMRNN